MSVNGSISTLKSAWIIPFTTKIVLQALVEDNEYINYNVARKAVLANLIDFAIDYKDMSVGKQTLSDYPILIKRRKYLK